MKIIDEKKVRKEIVKAMAREARKQIEAAVDHADPQAGKALEALIRAAGEAAMHEKTKAEPTPILSPDDPLVFKDESHEKPIKITISGWGKALRESMAGKPTSNALQENMQVQVEFGWNF